MTENLIGHDELSLRSSLADFKSPADEQTEQFLRGCLRFDGGCQVDGTFTRLSPDDYIVAIWHPATDTVAVLLVSEDSQEESFERPDGQIVTFKPKVVTGYQVMGKGQAQVESAEELIREIRWGHELKVARDIDGFG